MSDIDIESSALLPSGYRVRVQHDSSTLTISDAPGAPPPPPRRTCLSYLLHGLAATCAILGVALMCLEGPTSSPAGWFGMGVTAISLFANVVVIPVLDK